MSFCVKENHISTASGGMDGLVAGRPHSFEGLVQRQSRVLKRWKTETLVITPVESGVALSNKASVEYGLVPPDCTTLSPLSDDLASPNLFGFQVFSNEKTHKFRATDAAQLRSFFAAMGHTGKGTYTPGTDVRI